MNGSTRGHGFEWRGYVFAILMIVAATLLFIQGREYFAKGQWALLYLLIIVFVASRSGVRASILAAVTAFLAWNYFFLPPYHTFRVYDPKDWLSLFAFLIVGIIMGLQTGRLREREALARAREHETSLLNVFSAHLVSDLSVDEMADVLASEVARSVGAGLAILFTPGGSGGLTQLGSSAAVGGDVVRLVEWSYRQSKAVGLTEVTEGRSIQRDGWPISVSHAEVGFAHPGDSIVIPLQTATRQEGVLYISPKESGWSYTASEARVLVAIANQAAAFLERKHLQTVAIQADALREADRMKSTFVSSISHELKTPLSSINATVTNLLEGDLAWDESAIRAELTAVLADLDRLNDSINSLVDLSRLESCAWSPNRDWYELGEILGTVSSKVPVRQRERIVFALPDDLPPVYVDYAQWARVLGNLIENALDYSDPEEKVYVGAGAAGREIRMWVEDRGPGIPPEEREDIFNKFYRGSTSARVASGTGLGLAIAREIVRFHGGRIWVEDAQPHGARFVISLPANAEESRGA